MPPIRDSNGAVIPRAKRNADGEDISRAVVPSARRRPGASTSSKAIIQRHGRHGIWGDGQMSFIRKLSGQEKLALKAGEFIVLRSVSGRLVHEQSGEWRVANGLAPEIYEADARIIIQRRL